jgi:hypothetical protein
MASRQAHKRAPYSFYSSERRSTVVGALDARSPHGFFGIEGILVNEITSRMKTTRRQ